MYSMLMNVYLLVVCMHSGVTCRYAHKDVPLCILSNSLVSVITWDSNGGS